MELTVYSIEKAAVGKVAVHESLTGKPNTALLHQVVVAQQTNRRQGNAKVKNRHEVAGSTRKIYRQKGTGGARHGDIKAPLFVGGGRAFGPKPRNYEVLLPQKIRQAALREAILLPCSEEKILILESLEFGEIKTRKAEQIFRKFSITSGLVVLEAANTNAEKSIRNLSGFKACRIEALNVLDILHFQHLILTRKVYDVLASKWNASVV